MTKPRRWFATAALFISLALPSWCQSFDVEFMPISKGVWLHRSYAMIAGYKTPSNGLLLATDKSLVLIDTAWDDAETETVLEFASSSLKLPIAACIVTHSHQDRAGGMGAILRKGIPVYMTKLTYALLTMHAPPFPYTEVLNKRVAVDGLVLAIDYFGPAHAPDNISIWDGRDSLLFAGCMIKSLDARDMGNVADADLANWPLVLRKLKAKYPGAKVVVPGHGDYGDMRLIDHTLDLLAARKP